MPNQPIVPNQSMISDVQGPPQRIEEEEIKEILRDRPEELEG